MLIQYLIIILALVLIAIIAIKISKKDFSIEINKLIQYLGGKDNIIDVEVNMSRLKVKLKDVKNVDKEGITKLGAKGIVEVDNQLKIIFGPESKTLKKYIVDLKKWQKNKKIVIFFFIRQITTTKFDKLFLGEENDKNYRSNFMFKFYVISDYGILLLFSI